MIWRKLRDTVINRLAERDSSQTDLANHLGLKRTMIANWLNSGRPGRRETKLPSRYWEACADYLQLTGFERDRFLDMLAILCIPDDAAQQRIARMLDRLTDAERFAASLIEEVRKETHDTRS